ncbi:MAG: T9SS type A sorting domain-containing protein [Bacteroidota bacterium]
MKVNFRLIVIVFCMYALNINAQVSLMLEDKEVMKGEVFTVDVSVSGFEKIVGMQFSMAWEEAFLRPIGVENFGLDGLNSDKFGIFEEQVSIQWSDPSATFAGVSLADSTVIFSMQFRALEQADSAMIHITDSPALIEFFNSDDIILEVQTDSSFVKIIDDSMTSTTTIQQDTPLQLHHNSPNPFTENTIIQIDAAHSQETDLRIFDQTGIEIQTLNLRLNRGANFIELNSSLFPESGIYYYQLLTDYYAKTKKLVVVR